MLAVRAAFIQGRRHAPILFGFEVAEGQILQLPLQLPHAQAVGERRIHRPRFQRTALAVRHRQFTRMAQGHQFLREPRQHQPWIAHYGQQHLAQRLGLRGIKALRRRPVAGQAEVAQALQRQRGVGGWLPDDSSGLLRGEGTVSEQRPHQQRARQIGAAGERAHDFGRLVGERMVHGHARARVLERGTRRGEGIANLGRAQLAGFPG